MHTHTHTIANTCQCKETNTREYLPLRLPGRPRSARRAARATSPPGNPARGQPSLGLPPPLRPPRPAREWRARATPGDGARPLRCMTRPRWHRRRVPAGRSRVTAPGVRPRAAHAGVAARIADGIYAIKRVNSRAG